MAAVYDLTFTSEIDPQLFVNKVTHYYLEGRYVLIDVIAWPVDIGVHGEEKSLDLGRYLLLSGKNVSLAD